MTRLRAWLWSLRRAEPAQVVGLLGSLLALAVAFGLDLDATQQAAVLGALPYAVALIIRGQVWSPESHDAAVELAAKGRRR